MPSPSPEAAPPRAVLLDLGNVLAFHDNALLFRTFAQEAGLEAGEVERRLLHAPLWTQANRGLLDAEAIRSAVCGALGLTLPPRQFQKLWSCHFTVHDAVLPLVEGLVGRVKLGLVSNTNWAHVAWLKPHLPVLERFDAVLYSCAEGLVKPEPALYLRALERVGCAPGEAAFFDDLPEYVEAARALGLRARLFTTADAFAADLRALGL